MEIKTVSLINQLESVKSGLTAKETIQQSNCFVFKDGQVYTFNDEIFATCQTDLDLEGAVQADSLLKLLNKVKDEHIEIETDDSELKITGKNFETGIKLESEILLPVDEIEIPEDDEFTKVPNNFSKLAKLACFTASKSLNKALLTCVHIEDNKIESCDNDRITICKIKEELDHDVLIPAKNLSQIVKEQIQSIAFDDSWAHFYTDEGVIMSCRLFSNEDDEYVDLEEHVPDDEGRKIKFPTEISEILDRADIFGQDEESGDKMAKIQIKKGKLTITAQNETGWYKEGPVKVDSKENISFSVNPDFLKDVAKMTDEIYIVDDTLMFTDDNSTHLVKLED